MIRTKAADLAEWIVPELAPHKQGRSWRLGLVAFATVSAIAILAVTAWADAIEIGFTAPREMRAGMGAF